MYLKGNVYSIVSYFFTTRVRGWIKGTLERLDEMKLCTFFQFNFTCFDKFLQNHEEYFTIRGSCVTLSGRPRESKGFSDVSDLRITEYSEGVTLCLV